MTKDNCYLLGYVSKTHGVNGEICFVIDADNPEYYKKMESVFIELNNNLVPFFISKISVRNNVAIVKLEDINGVEQAKELVEQDLYLPLSFLPPLSDTQFYYHEIIGFQVSEEVLGPLGIITSVLDFPQQIIVEMNYKNKEILFPVTDHTIIKVDRANKTLFVKLPEGLLEVYL